MAMNRYGRVYHSDHHYNTLRFPSADVRAEFAEKFEKYHASHDHDGEPPRFESVTAAEANKAKVHNSDSVTIDGYTSYEIHAYHDRNDDSYVHYRPPTTIAPLVIVTENQGEFIDSSTLTRHELSEIFMDMPDEDFQNLLKSVERNGFKDPIIRMIDTQVLDGWHRYRAAKKLNLLRKLRFRQWKEQYEGDPAAFVMARNIERRHLTPGQRAQIVVSFNERFGHGGDRSEASRLKDNLKTHEELAKEGSVSKRTIDRAVQVEKVGQSEAVISGKKTVNQVLYEMETLSGQVVSKGVYFLKNVPSGDIKIGFTHQLKPRISAIQTSTPDRLELLHVIPDGTQETETVLHERFSELLVSGEWFQGTSELLEFINGVISGDKSAGEVIKEETIKSLLEDLSAEMKDWKKRHAGVDYASKSSLIQAYREQKESDETGNATVEELKGILALMREDLKSYAVRVKYLQTDERKSYEKEQLEQRYKGAAKRMWEAIWTRQEKIVPQNKGVHVQNFITAACDAHPMWGVANFPKNAAAAAATGTLEVWKGRYDLVATEITIETEWVETFLKGEYSDLGSEKMEPKSASEIIDDVLEKTKAPTQETESTASEQEPESDKESLPLQDWLDETKSADATEQQESETQESESPKASVDRRENGCRARLRSILEEHHKLDETVYDLPALCKEFELNAVRIEVMARDMFVHEREKAQNAWQKAWTKVRTAWFDYDELSKSIEWETFTAAVLEQTDMGLLTADTFENPDSRLESNDLELLMNEKNCLLTLGYHIRNPSFWVRDLIPEPEASVDQEEKEALSLSEKTEALKSEVKGYLPAWRQNNPHTTYATLFHLLDARFRLKHNIPRGRSPFFFEELDDLLLLMKANDSALADKVREILATDPSGVKSTTEAETEHLDVDEPVDDELSETERYYDRNQREVVRNAIAPLIEKISADDDVPVLSWDHKRMIEADIMDVFISYENPPADKQMVLILLDVIDGILSEPIV